MIRTNRLNAALILCKQKLLQWDRQNYQIVERELGINVEQTSEIMPNIITLQTNYLKSNTEAGLWMRERFEFNYWNIGKSIMIYDSENTRVMSIRFLLPQIVLKVPENWNKQLKNIIIDFSFYIEIIRSSTLSDDCSITQSIPDRYMCKATPLVRFANDTTVIGFDVIHKIFRSIPTREMSVYF